MHGITGGDRAGYEAIQLVKDGRWQMAWSRQDTDTKDLVMMNYVGRVGCDVMQRAHSPMTPRITG